MGLLMHYNSAVGLDYSELADDIDALGNDDGDNTVYVECDDCDEYMEYLKGFGRLEGVYRCPVCKTVVNEFEVMDRINEENLTMLKEMEIEE